MVVNGVAEGWLMRTIEDVRLSFALCALICCGFCADAANAVSKMGQINVRHCFI